MGWWADGLMGQCIAWYIRKCNNWKDWTMQWGNGKMGNWGYVYKKDMEAILNLKQEQVQACKPWVICHKHTQMVEMIMTNESQTIKKKEFKKFGKMPTVHRCSPSVVVRLGGGAACGGILRRGVCSAPSECVFAIDDSTFAALNLLSLQVQFCLHAFSVDMAEHVRTARPNSTLVSLCY